MVSFKFNIFYKFLIFLDIFFKTEGSNDSKLYYKFI